MPKFERGFDVGGEELQDLSDLVSRLKNKKRRAKGTTALVYRASHQGRKIALKEFLAHPEIGDGWDRAVEEVIVSRSLNCRFAPRFLFAGQIGEGTSRSVVLATTFHEGKTLFELIDSLGSRPHDYRVRLALKFGSFCLRAVAHLKRLGIVHRDIKPENIIVTDEEQFEFRLIDFGLARRLSRLFQLPSSWRVNAASKFRSPEKWSNFSAADHKGDVWSIGVIMYRILNGSYPFESLGKAASEDDLRNKILFEPPSTMGLATANVVALNRQIAWLLRKDKQMRPAPAVAARIFSAGDGPPKYTLAKAQIPAAASRLVRAGHLIASQCCTWSDSPSGLRVGQISERLIAINAWGIQSDRAADYLSRSIGWLSEQTESGAFFSKGFKHTTTFATAIALIALSRSLAREDLDSDSRSLAVHMLAEGRKALVASRREKGWSWFVGEGPAHRLATSWAALALAELGETSHLHETLHAASRRPQGDFSGLKTRELSELSLGVFGAARLAELGHSSVDIDRWALASVRHLFELSLNGKIETVGGNRIYLPLSVKQSLNDLRYTYFGCHIAAIVSSSIYSYSITNPFLLDGALRLSMQQLEHFRTERDFFTKVWFSISVFGLHKLLAAHGLTADSVQMTPEKFNGAP